MLKYKKRSGFIVIKLESADWYQNCNFKIEYVDIEKSELQKKKNWMYMTK